MPSAVWSEFEDMDAAADPDRFVRYLDELRSLGDTAEYKARSYERLGVRSGEVEPRRVLDVGCGVGHDCTEMAERGGGRVAVTGVDPSAHFLEIARSRAAARGLSIAFHEGAADRLPFAADSFTGCRCDRVFLYLERPEAAVAEMCRVVEPGGTLWIRDPDMATYLIDGTGIDPGVTAEVARSFSEGFANGWSGRRLFGLLRRQGVADVVVEPSTLVCPTLGEADALFAIRRSALGAAAAGRVGEAEIEAWLDALAAADAEGTFWFSLTFFEAFGTVG